MVFPPKTKALHEALPPLEKQLLGLHTTWHEVSDALLSELQEIEGIGLTRAQTLVYRNPSSIAHLHTPREWTKRWQLSLGEIINDPSALLEFKQASYEDAQVAEIFSTVLKIPLSSPSPAPRNIFTPASVRSLREWALGWITADELVQLSAH